MNGTDIGRIRIPVILAGALIFTVVSSTVTAMVAVYGVRDTVTRDLTTRIEAARSEELAAMREMLAHYVSTESWLNWRQADRERQDKATYDLMTAIAKLDRSMSRK